MAGYGDATLELIESIREEGVDHVVALMRHSAREFEPGRHDLLNPLTDAGREFARAFGAALPKQLLVRGYTSPAQRCVETTDLILEGHAAAGGSITRSRPIEALGVFYVLDQMRMYRAMTAATGQVPFLASWFAGDVPADVMMPAALAAKLLGGVVASKLKAPIQRPQLDVCVSHDMSLYLVRDRLLELNVVNGGEVAFLDGVVFYEKDEHVWMRGLHGSALRVDLTI
jgi:hypothetical protein